MPIRIMHVVDHLGIGGLENGLVNLIHHLDSGRFEHIVYTVRRLGPNADRLRESGARVVCLPNPRSSIQFPALTRAIHEVNPDIVHSRNWAGVEAVLADGWHAHAPSSIANMGP